MPIPTIFLVVSFVWGVLALLGVIIQGREGKNIGIALILSVVYLSIVCGTIQILTALAKFPH